MDHDHSHNLPPLSSIMHKHNKPNHPVKELDRVPLEWSEKV